jgi:release factor glutamine methyltransferase
MRPAEVARRAAGYLDRHGVEPALPTAELLLAHVLETDRAGLYRREEALTGPESRRFGRALCRRCSGVPLQHLTGEEGFRRLILEVRPGVFIPRPETEGLVDVALDTIHARSEPVVVDVGTGTGAIALCIATEHPGARIWAVDLAPEAVDLARANAARLAPHVVVMQGDLLGSLPAELRGVVDLVVSNPPYIAPGDVASLPAEVRAEPVLALVGGVDLYARLAEQAGTWLRPGGALVVEIEETTAAEVGAALEGAGFIEVDVRPDLAGRDRMVAARWP